MTKKPPKTLSQINSTIYNTDENNVGSELMYNVQTSSVLYDPFRPVVFRVEITGLRKVGKSSCVYVRNIKNVSSSLQA